VDPVPDPLLFSGSAGNRTLASGSVAKYSDNSTTEAVQKKAKHVVIEELDPTRSRSGIDQRTPMEKVK
jgi:hypothetical protein